MKSSDKIADVQPQKRVKTEKKGSKKDDLSVEDLEKQLAAEGIINAEDLGESEELDEDPSEDEEEVFEESEDLDSEPEEQDDEDDEDEEEEEEDEDEDEEEELKPEPTKSIAKPSKAPKTEVKAESFTIQGGQSKKPFSDLHLSEPTQKALDAMGFTTMTSVQEHTIPPLLAVMFWELPRPEAVRHWHS